MDIAEHINCLSREGQLLAATAERAGPGAEVPTCPGWQVRDLLRHTGMVHRWATTYVLEGHTSYRPGEGEPKLDGDALLGWFREGHALLTDALGAAPEDLECWAFLPAPSPLAFWARRQAHETAIHRTDAESALGGAPSALPTDFAVDGIDELLRAFHARGRSRVRTEKPCVLRVRATDSGDVWTVRLSQEAPRAVHTKPADAGVQTAGAQTAGAQTAGAQTAGAQTAGAQTAGAQATEEAVADCELSGSAEQLNLTLWNRLPLGALTSAGDSALAALWREKSGITWS